MGRLLAVAAAILLPLAACTPDRGSIPERLERANQLMRTSGGDPSRRALAYDLYLEVLAGSDDPQARLDAHFGVGMIGLLDIAQGLTVLVAGTAGDEATAPTESEEGDQLALPPAEQLVDVVDTALHELLEKGIVDHWAHVVAEDDYTFTFEEEALVLDLGNAGEVDLSGEWDLTEIRLVYGLLQTTLALEEYVYSYDGILETIMEAALSDGEIPDLPNNPAGLPDWIVDATLALDVKPLPWLEAEFAVLNPDADLSAIRARLSDGLGQVVAGLQYLQAETDDQSDDAFDQDAFISSLVTTVLPGEEDASPVLQVVDGLLTPAELEELAARLAASLDEDDTIFLPTDTVWELLDTALGTVGFDGPRTPDELRIPAVNLSRIFTDAIPDLKAQNGGLLPYYCATAAEQDDWGCAQLGRFVSVSEQEPFNDDDGDGTVDAGEYTDAGIDGFVDADGDGQPDNPNAGRPGRNNDRWDEPIALRGGDALLGPIAHESPVPTTDVDRPNGIVDPVYLFMPNPSVNGIFVPVTDATGDGDFAADPTDAYRNNDLMRLLSNVAWLLETDALQGLLAGDEDE